MRYLGADDIQLACAFGVVQPVVQAAALDGVVEFTRAVAGEDSDRRHIGPHRAHLGNANLVFTQVLQQKRLKRLIGAVHLVDQQHGTGHRCLQRLQQGAADEITLLVDLTLDSGHVNLLRTAAGPPQGAERPLGGQQGHASAERGGKLCCTHVEQLCGVIPLIQRFALLQPVVTLQTDERALQRRGQCLGQFGLAHAGLTFEQQGALQLERQEHSRCQTPVCEIASSLQGSDQRVDGWEHNHGNPCISLLSIRELRTYI